MIEIIKSYKVGDQLFVTVEAAQAHSLQTFFRDHLKDVIGVDDWNPLANAILSKKEHIVDLLTMKATSKPRARAVNGGTKKRTPKPQAAPMPKPEAA
jgi:hypothetical protein